MTMRSFQNDALRCACVAFLIVGIAVSGTATAAPFESVFNPSDYSALNGDAALNYSSGTLSFDTDSGAVTHSADGSLGTGAVDESNANGDVKMTVFTFSSINLQSGVSISVTGRRGIVLASQGDLIIGSAVTLGVQGTAGETNGDTTGWSDPKIGKGGPGADGTSTSEDGNRGGSTQSAPPGTYGGDGGWVKHLYTDSYNGRGVGGGISVFGLNNRGGGGGYGGAGDAGTVAGGPSYGDDYLESLLGGSGGGGSSKDHSESYGGGGGSGGGVLLAGSTIGFDGAINAYGGNGYSSTVGAGGGGRVAFYVGNIWGKTLAELNTFNGDDDGNGLGGDLAEPVDGLTFGASEGAVDIRGMGDNAGRHGSFYVLAPPPPAGTVVFLK